jgi:hypothetical protein
MEELQHSYLTGAWHYCGICYEKCKLHKMKWQRGVLRCPTCVDKELLGVREQRIAVVLEDGKEELAPPIKLREPALLSEEEDIII